MILFFNFWLFPELFYNLLYIKWYRVFTFHSCFIIYCTWNDTMFVLLTHSFHSCLCSWSTHCASSTCQSHRVIGQKCFWSYLYVLETCVCLFKWVRLCVCVCVCESDCVTVYVSEWDIVCDVGVWVSVRPGVCEWDITCVCVWSLILGDSNLNLFQVSYPVDTPTHSHTEMQTHTHTHTHWWTEISTWLDLSHLKIVTPNPFTVQVHAVLPLVPLTFPTLWIIANTYGQARILAAFHVAKTLRVCSTLDFSLLFSHTLWCKEPLSSFWAVQETNLCKVPRSVCMPFKTSVQYS